MNAVAMPEENSQQRASSPTHLMGMRTLTSNGIRKVLSQRFLVASLSLGLLCWPVTAGFCGQAGGRAIDRDHSSLKIHVSKSGFFSAFAHNHDIEAPIVSGDVQTAGSSSVELRVDARKLRVLDPELSESTRARIQKTMEGPQVLDADRFPEIHFLSNEVEAKGADHWVVRGTLDLHGQSHPVTVGVTFKDGFYRGSAMFKQSAFGMTPVTVAGGTVKVKDELKVDFSIALAK
jgi:polyisoprenoid-binding protein YceI